jgi:hypothetical protein
MKLLIVQTSPKHTASTVLVNALYGIISELKGHRCVYINRINWGVEEDFNNVLLVKSHLPISAFRTKYTGKYNLLFICSQRPELNLYVHDKGPDVVVFDYAELNETPTNPVSNIIDNIYNRVRGMLPEIQLDKQHGIDRVNAMNARYKEIEHLPFRYYDPFFHIHGSHRNRDTAAAPRRCRMRGLPKSPA